MNIESDGKHVFMYAYTLSNGAAWTSTALFGAATVAHIGYMIPTRSWFFIPFILGGICETLGYCSRAWQAREPTRASPYFLQLLLLLAAPTLLSATIYVSLGRAIRSLDAASYAPLRPRHLTAICVLVDVLALASQLGGAAAQAASDAVVVAADRKAVAAGLGVQLGALALFVAAAARVHARLEAGPTDLALALRWRRYVWAIEGAAGAVLVRDLVRLVECGQGPRGFVAAHEMFVYVFDALPIWAVMVGMLVCYPGQLVKTSMRRMEGIYSGTDMAVCDLNPLKLDKERRWGSVKFFKSRRDDLT
ncbi:RTA1 like protein [Neofusicoccum parvum]|uniref:RTA1 like protein n=1 Tax=Neofusicoccum parvum TaxID=310453 RepID=A0ACB5SB25_9PEZI|nr:RTA1 like protein [Neofusicoccum parvum]